MNKRFVVFALLAGLLTGCQTGKQASVLDVIDEVEHKQAAVQPKPPEEAAKAPAVVAPVVEEVQEVAPVQQTVEEPKTVERKTVMILMKTSKGDIKLELDPEKAPKTVANFLAYAEAGHYNGTIFHRVMDGFMVQGGGFDADMNQKPAPNTVENEAKNGLKNTIGSVAMARTPDPHSASAQFFINVNNNSFLDYPGQDGWGYCVFGKVVEGMDVVNEIKEVKTGNNGYYQNVPVEPITITEVTVLED